MNDYDFLSLSPSDFEYLVRDLLEAEFGLEIESFGPGKDGGIDLRFATSSGTTIVQAKRYSPQSAANLRSELLKDKEKILKLQPSRYILATTANLTPQATDRLIADLSPLPITQDDVFARSRLNKILSHHPRIEERNFKLWLSSTAVLQRVLHNAQYERSTSELEDISRRIRLFVPNASVFDAYDLLENNGNIIISGAPGVGKTTLARMLIWLHAHDGWELVAIDSIPEGFDVLDPARRQLFFFDDFLGQVRLSPDYVREVDQRLLSFTSRVQNSENKRFIMTTREYIYRAALAESDKIISVGLQIDKYLLDVGKYTRPVKALMLYNHVFFSDLSEEHRNAILSSDAFIEIIDHPNINPRLIETITTPEFFSGLSSDQAQNLIVRTLRRPTVIWENAYKRHISPDARAVLATVFFLGNAAPYQIVEDCFPLLRAWAWGRRMETDVDACKDAVRELEGSFLTLQRGEVSFANPSIVDFLEGIFASNEAAAAALGEFPVARLGYEAQRFIARRGTPQAAAATNASRERTARRFAELPPRLSYVGTAGEELTYRDVPWIDRLELVAGWCGPDSPELCAICAEIGKKLEADKGSNLNIYAATSTLVTLLGCKWDASRAIDSVERRLVYASENEYISFDEIQHLSKFADDYERYLSIFKPDDVAQIVDLVIDNLDNELSDIGSIEELYRFSSEFELLVQRYGRELPDWKRRRDDRLEAIYDLLSEPDADHAPNLTAAVEMTDAQIRSLFETLRSGT